MWSSIHFLHGQVLTPCQILNYIWNALDKLGVCQDWKAASQLPLQTWRVMTFNFWLSQQLRTVLWLAVSLPVLYYRSRAWMVATICECSQSRSWQKATFDGLGYLDEFYYPWKKDWVTWLDHHLQRFGDWIPRARTNQVASKKKVVDD